MIIQDMTPGRKGFKPTKEELYDWLDKQVLCNVASIGEDGYPNAATVAFSQDKQLNFFIITDEQSRKSINISRDARVCLTITNEDDRYTVQLEGDAHKLTWEEFEAQQADYHYKKLPVSLPFKDIPGQVPVHISPKHIRFSDVSVRPWELTEFNLT